MYNHAMTIAEPTRAALDYTLYVSCSVYTLPHMYSAVEAGVIRLETVVHGISSCGAFSTERYTSSGTAIVASSNVAARALCVTVFD